MGNLEPAQSSIDIRWTNADLLETGRIMLPILGIFRVCDSLYIDALA